MIMLISAIQNLPVLQVMMPQRRNTILPERVQIFGLTGMSFIFYTKNLKEILYLPPTLILPETLQKLLATAPLLLERRFEAMRTKAEHDAALTTPDAQPHAWLQHFDREWQAHLLAELDLRLQPVLGLVEALGQASEAHA